MQILDFLELYDVKSRNECERAKLLCFFSYKETGEQQFYIEHVAELITNAGFSAPNTSRLKQKLLKEKTMKVVKGSSLLEFVPAVLQQFEREFGNHWSNYETIVSDSELIDEIKFGGKRNYLTRLIVQINASYKHNCYDGCAVLMRRLFEVILIMAYQKLNIDDDIKGQDGGYLMLDYIVKNAINNQTLRLSRIKNEFDMFRKVGNFSAHGLTYTAGKKDIDDIKLNYRVMLQELFDKAGLFDKGEKVNVQ